MKKNLSPISIMEQFLFDRLGNTPVKVWHYLILLTLLFVVPVFLPSSIFSNQTFLIIFSILVLIVWMGSRLAGRQVSKTSTIDSVLIYRFFAASSWIIPTVIGWLSILFGRTSNHVERQFFVLILCFMTFVSFMHITGIIIHFRHKDKLIRNVKKEDLFQ